MAAPNAAPPARGKGACEPLPIGETMPFKPNYRLERAERTRRKEAKKLEKQEAREARRKAKAETPADGETPDGHERTQEEN